VDDPAAREAILDASTGNRLPHPWLSHMARQSLIHSLPSAAAAYLNEWTSADFSAQVQGNPVPVKVIIGEHDPSLSAERMKQTWLAWYPNAELEMLANTGHYPMYEVPLTLPAALQDFFGHDQDTGSAMPNK